MSIVLSANVDKFILDERLQQIKNYGTERDLQGEYGYDNWLKTKLVVLMEEVGELAKESLEHNPYLAMNEAIQVAAVAKAIVEGLAHHIDSQK